MADPQSEELLSARALAVAPAARVPLASASCPASERPRERLALRGPRWAARRPSSWLIVWGFRGRGGGARRTWVAEALWRGSMASPGWRARPTRERPALPRHRSGEKAAQLTAAFELGRRAVAGPAGRGAGRCAPGPRDVVEQLQVSNGPARARGAAGRRARAKHVVLLGLDGLCRQRVRVPGADRRAVPGRRPQRCRGRSSRAQPPIGRPDTVARMISTSPPRPSRRAGCSMWRCWTTWSSPATHGSACVTGACSSTAVRSAGPGVRR